MRYEWWIDEVSQEEVLMLECSIHQQPEANGYINLRNKAQPEWVGIETYPYRFSKSSGMMIDSAWQLRRRLCG